MKAPKAFLYILAMFGSLACLPIGCNSGCVDNHDPEDKQPTTANAGKSELDLDGVGAFALIQGSDVGVTAMAVSEDGKHIVWGDDNGVVRLFAFSETEPVKLFTPEAHCKWPAVHSILFDKNKTICWASGDGYVMKLSIDKKHKKDKPTEVRISSAAASSTAVVLPDSVIVSGWTKTKLPQHQKVNMVRYFLKDNKETASDAVFPGQRGANELIQHLSISPDHKMLAVVADGDCALLDVENLKILRRFGQGWGEAAAFSPSSERIALGTDGRGILVWQVKTGHLIKHFKLDRAATIKNLCFLSENIIYAGTGPHSELFTADLKTGKVSVIGKLPGLTALIHIKDRKMVAAGLQNGDVVFIKE